jgi:DNA modification methylase
MQQQPLPPSHQALIKGNTLYELPKMKPNQFDAVITSPPYANRYDYTRTYALELAFLAELYRTCKSGAHIAFVNDNVRYAGEVIPVDLLSTDLARLVGFQPVKVYVLPQRKGNSSQQMGKFGRRELRKSITIWEKL